MSVAAVIVAGGSGKRMGTSIKKQYLKIKDKEVLAHTVEKFQQCREVDEIIVVTGEEDIDYVKHLLEMYGFHKVKAVVAGGLERQNSVYNGLNAMSKEVRYVLIHDGARPFVTRDIIKKGLEAAYEHGACIVAVPVKDTIKQVNPKGCVEHTPKREMLWSVQTPQVFSVPLIMEAHEQAIREGVLGTDDSMLVESLGKQVYVVKGEYSNIKITTPEDLIVAEALIETKK